LIVGTLSRGAGQMQTHFFSVDKLTPFGQGCYQNAAKFHEIGGFDVFQHRSKQRKVFLEQPTMRWCRRAERMLEGGWDDGRFKTNPNDLSRDATQELYWGRL
jgi:hypothetical protein